MAKKGPKTIRGMLRKDLTRDGRKSVDKAIREELYGKKKKRCQGSAFNSAAPGGVASEVEKMKKKKKGKHEVYRLNHQFTKRKKKSQFGKVINT